MKTKIKNIVINIEELFIIFVIVLFFSPTVKSYFDGYILCFCFIIFHECAHMLIAGLFGDKLKQVNIKLCGMNAVIKITNELHPRWILIYLAGPISNLLLAIFFSNINIVKDINIALALINVLPIKPLDGFNVIKIVLNWMFSKSKVEMILKILERGVLLVIIILGIIVFIKYNNPSIIIFCSYLILILSV